MMPVAIEFRRRPEPPQGRQSGDKNMVDVLPTLCVQRMIGRDTKRPQATRKAELKFCEPSEGSQQRVVASLPDVVIR